MSFTKDEMINQIRASKRSTRKLKRELRILYIKNLLNERKKITFYKYFKWSLRFIVLDQIIKLFLTDNDKLPPLGNIIYHVFSTIISFLSTISISVLSAIIFYYISEFIHERKHYAELFEIQNKFSDNVYLLSNIFTNLDIFKTAFLNKECSEVVSFLRDFNYSENLFDIDSQFKRYPSSVG